jgi:hypothetical protein
MGKTSGAVPSTDAKVPPVPPAMMNHCEFMLKLKENESKGKPPLIRTRLRHETGGAQRENSSSSSHDDSNGAFGKFGKFAVVVNAHGFCERFGCKDGQQPGLRRSVFSSRLLHAFAE